MKKILLITAVAACCCACVEEYGSSLGKEESASKLVGNPFGEKQEGTLLVKFTDNAVKGMEDGTFDSAKVLGGLDEVSIDPIFPASSDNISVSHGLHKWHMVSFISKQRQRLSLQ